MKNPTVIEWLEKTHAQAVYLGTYWKIELQDGWVNYTEYKDEKGVLYVDRVDPHSDDPKVMKRLEALRAECQKIMDERKKQSGK
jgi:hypothetical protein